VTGVASTPKGEDGRPHVAILDDWLNLSQELADWTPVTQRARLTVLRQHLSPGEAVAALQDVDVVCHMRERMAMPRALLQALPRLKMIAITGPKHRTLDLQAAHEQGITVCWAPSDARGTTGTTELAWGLILSLARHIPQEAAAMQRGGWQNTCGRVLNGRTLGLLGLGRLGRLMVPVARAFGMDVIAWSQNMTPEAAQEAGARHVAKDELFAQSDFLSLHVVLSERTRQIVGRRELGLMKPDACLVNTSRAGLVDEVALQDALRAGRIAGAGIDVYEREPLPEDDPWRAVPRTVLTPHLGYATRDVLGVFYRHTVENVAAWLDGRPIRVVTD